MPPCCHTKVDQMPNIALTTLLVRDYDEAIRFYVESLGFALAQDTAAPEGSRWVVVRPSDSTGGLLLARADNDAERARVGSQTDGRVAFFLHTDDFQRDYTRMRNVGVAFLESPRIEDYGTVAVFRDLYGNLWDLLQPAV